MSSLTVSNCNYRLINTISYISLIFIVILIYGISVFPQFATFLNIIITLITLLNFVCVLIITKRINISLIIVFVISFLLILLSLDISRVSTLVFASFMYIYRFMNKKRLAKTIFLISLLCFLIILIAYFFGFNTEYDTEIWRPLIGETVSRKSFGFTHPNQFMINWLSIIIAYIYSRRINCLHMVLIFVVTYIFYYYTQSRTVFYIIVFLTILVMLLLIFNKAKTFKKIKSKNYKNIIIIALLFFFVFSIVFSIYGKGTYFDTLLSGRLTINYNMLRQGVSLLGNSILEDKTFDNSYLHLLLTKGILFTITYIYIFYMYFKNKKVNLLDFISITAVLLLAFIEVCFLKINIMLIIALVSNQNYKKETYDL